MRTNVFQTRIEAIRAICLKELPEEFRVEERGSLTIFSLFIFILILMVAGMAVDLMHYEKERVSLQNSMDSAILAAAALNQDVNTSAEIEALVKEYVQKAGHDPDLVTVASNIETVGSIETGRSITATANFQTDTMFMGMLGIDNLAGYSGGGAREGQQMIEISLVLDISGSMGRNSKMTNLKTAAKEFVTTMIQNSGSHRVSISVVPYNHQVRVSEDLRSRLNWDNQSVEVVNTTGTGALAGALTQYSTYDASAPCASFTSSDFQTRRLASATTIDSAGYFADGSSNFGSSGISQPSGQNYWCGTGYPTMIVYQNDETLLHNYIDSLSADGWTAIDYGMNWGVGILDPSFGPVVTDLVDNSLLPAQMAGHPVAYDNVEVMKYVVLMTDGINTKQKDLKPAFKDGASRIWYSDTRANGNEYNGYLVEMPDNSASQRWYVPGSPTTTSDDVYLAEGDASVADAVQWDYHKLYQRFRTDDAAEYFFEHSGDNTAFNAHNDVVDESGGYTVADSNVRNICDTAKANDLIEIFAVSFEAPADAETLLQYCASKPGNYFDVQGTQISDAFSAIATQISQLRLTQ